MLNTLYKREKDEFEFIRKYLKKHSDDLNSKIEEEQEELDNLKKKIAQQFENGEYFEISNLSEKAGILDKNIYESNKNVQKTKELINKVEEFLTKFEKSNLDGSLDKPNGDVSEIKDLEIEKQIDLENQALSLISDEEFREKINYSRYYNLKFMQSYLSNSIEELKLDIEDAQADLAYYHVNSNKMFLKDSWEELSNLAQQANESKNILYSKDKLLKEAINLYEEIEEVLPKINMKSIKRIISGLTNDTFNLINACENFNVKSNDVEEKKQEEVSKKSKKVPGEKPKKSNKKVSKTIKKIESSLEDAESSLDADKLNQIKSEISLLKDEKEKERLLKRTEEIELKLNEAKFKNFEKMIENMNENNFDDVEKALTALENSSEKDELMKKFNCVKLEIKLKSIEDEITNDVKIDLKLYENKLNQIKTEISLLNDEKEKERLLEKVEEIETKIKEQKIKNVEEKIKEFEGSKGMADFVDANNALKALEDCPKKEGLMQRLNCAQLEKTLNSHENKINNNEEIENEEIKRSIEIYRILKEENRHSYKDRLNEVISYSNRQQQYKKQEEELDEKPKKYGFLTKFSEFVAGGLINSITASKFYRNHLQKKLEKAEEKSDDKKKQKIENKINQIGIVNGIRLFVNRNRIASLKPKLCKENSKLGTFGRLIQNIRTKRYDRAISYVSDKMSKKLYKLSQDSSTFENKAITKNVINQYLDNLSMTNNIEVASKEADDFIKEARGKGVIENCEIAAYNQEIKDILDFRKENEDYIVSDYVIEQDELDNMIKYYDEDSLSNEIWCLKK